MEKLLEAKVDLAVNGSISLIPSCEDERVVRVGCCFFKLGDWRDSWELDY